MHVEFEGEGLRELKNLLRAAVSSSFVTKAKIQADFKVLKNSNSNISARLPSEIPANFFKEGETAFALKASEICALLQTVWFILRSVEDKSFWNCPLVFSMLLRQHTLDQYLSNEILSQEKYKYMEETQRRQCEVYVDTYNHAVPKTHYRNHLPGEYAKFGTLRNVWTMNFERMHAVQNQKGGNSNFKSDINHLLEKQLTSMCVAKIDRRKLCREELVKAKTCWKIRGTKLTPGMFVGVGDNIFRVESLSGCLEAREVDFDLCKYTNYIQVVGYHTNTEIIIWQMMRFIVHPIETNFGFCNKNMTYLACKQWL